MTYENNTDPVQALIAKWRSESTSDDQSSDYECGEHSARSECADELEAAIASAPQQPVGVPVGDGCHCGTCTCNPNMTPAVRFDLSPAQQEEAIREHLIRLGWTPPASDAEAKASDARAEIEKLRREVEEWGRCAEAQAELHDEAERHADELAKALTELITWIPSADTYRRLGFDPEAPMRALERAKLSLGRGGRADV